MAEALIDAASDEEDASPSIVKELTDKRDEVTKYFAMSDGSIKACIYPTNVHYYSDGVYEEIDNTLTKSQKNNKTYYQNQKNSFTVTIPESFGEDEILFSDENGYVKFRLQGAVNQKASHKTKKHTAGETDAQNITDQLVYASLKENIDLEYDLSGNQLKETIVLQKKTKNAFVFHLSTSAAKVVVNNDRSISFFDEGGAETYTMAAPYMTDASGEYSNGITVKLKPLQNQGEYTLTYKPDYEWLSAKKRAYPVRIDPTLVQEIYKDTVTDTYVGTVQSASNPDIRGGWDVLNIGRRSTMSGGSQIDVHELTSGFTEGGTWWGNQPSYDAVVTDYVLVNTSNTFSGSTLSYDSYNLTRLVNKWHNGETNYGILLKYHDDTTAVSSSKHVFYFAKQSVYYGSVSKFVEITYRNTTGLEDYWSYETQDMGESGTGYVNLYNGNQVYVHEDAAYTSLITGFTLSHVYNSSSTNVSYAVNDTCGYFGKGWSLNLVEKLEPVSVSGNSAVKYVYTDGDKTRHYLVETESGTIVDEDGLGYTYADISEGELKRKLTAKDGTVLKFDYWNCLRRIIDTNGNTISINYAPIPDVDNYPISITTSSGGCISFQYDSAYHLTSVTDNGGRKTTYEYTNGTLSKITYPDGTKTCFTYIGEGKLSSVTSVAGTKLIYERDSSGKAIQKVRFLGTNEEDGGYTAFTYSQNQTKVTDTKGRSLTYQFDTYGRATCVYDNEQNIYSQTYRPNVTTASGIFGNNKLSDASSGAVYVNNLLTNPAFSNGITGYETYQESALDTFQTRSDIGLLSSVSIKLTNESGKTQTIYQTPNALPAGTYTFSGYLRTESVQCQESAENVESAENTGAGFEVVITGNGVTRKTYSVLLKGDTDSDTDNGFLHLTNTFTLEEGECVSKVSAGLYGASGNVIIDSLQLENGEAAGQINLLANSGFEEAFGENSTPSSFSDGYNDSYSGYTQSQKKEGDGSLRLCGFAGQNRYEVQSMEEIPILIATTPEEIWYGQKKTGSLLRAMSMEMQTGRIS